MSEISNQRWRDLGETLEYQGHRLFLRSEGQGEPLMLIHGFPTSSLDWARMWPVLAETRQVHAIDMLGFGLSDKPLAFPYSIGASADQWQHLACSKQLLEVDILAHDYGNTVALELLARQREGDLPFKIRSIAFLNGGLFPEATFPLLLQKLLLGPLGPLVASLSSFRSFAGSMRRICAVPLDETELRGQWQLLCRADGRRVLPKLIQYIRERRVHRGRWVGALQNAWIPVCLVDGVEDPISGASIVRRWRELLPDALAIELDGVGHYPQLEDPDRVLAAFQTFMQQVR